MKIFTLSKCVGGILKPAKASRDYKKLEDEMFAEYLKTLQDAGPTGSMYFVDGNKDNVVVNADGILHQWKIDTIITA